MKLSDFYQDEFIPRSLPSGCSITGYEQLPSGELGRLIKAVFPVDYATLRQSPDVGATEVWTVNGKGEEIEQIG